MDTRLKKFNDNVAVRTIAFILCIAFFVTAYTSMTVAIRSTHYSYSYDGNFTDLLSKAELEDSSLFSDYMNDYVEDMRLVLYNFKSPENIKSKNYPSAEQMDLILQEFYYNGTYTSPAESEQILIDRGGDYLNNDEFIEPSNGYQKDWYAQGVKEAFTNLFSKDIEFIKKTEKDFALKEYNRIKSRLEEAESIKYYGYYSGTALTNIDVKKDKHLGPDRFTNYHSYKFNIDNSSQHESTISYRDAYLTEDVTTTDMTKPGNASIFIALNPAEYDNMALEYESSQDAVKTYFYIILSTAIMAVILFVYLAIVTGRRDDDGNVQLYRADNWFTEIQLVIVAIGLALLGNLMGNFSINWGTQYTSTGSGSLNIPSIEETFLVATLCVGISVVGLWFLLSLIRNFKARTFLKNSLIARIIMYFAGVFKLAFSKTSPMAKVILVALAICALSATVALAPVVFIAVLIFAPKWVKKYDELKKGIDEVNSGNLEYRIPVDENSKNEFDILAREVNEISHASNVAIQNELKNQRLKTDLISNVSHDLKTPLTSIITYTDLLKKEGLEGEKAMEYLRVIDEKGHRLQRLTEDLFEAAKASSGAIPVNMERVDINALIQQGLGEMSDSLDESGLEVIINAEKEHYYVNADRQLLWRVVENLLNNVRKYALPNSRIYVDISEKKRNNSFKPMVIYEMKNMSNAPLNMSEEELMERFKRGDESRTTEGSGLGLAIARDLVKLQNGWFELKIDGDLFKTIVMLEPYTGEVESDN